MMLEEKNHLYILSIYLHCICVVFIFGNLVSILNDQWCWKNRSFEIDIVDKNQMDIDFHQFGYMLSCSLSHNAVLVSH